MRIKFWYFLTLGVIALDMLTKVIFDGKVAEFIPGFISINGTVHNYGASGGFLANTEWGMIFFIILAIAFGVGMIVFDCLYKKPFGANAWYKIGFTLILGGLIGNLIDRLVLGYVRDFINLQFMNFPVFNIADCALTVGCICLAIFFIFFLRFDKSSVKTIQIKKDNSAIMQENAQNLQDNGEKPTHNDEKTNILSNNDEK